MDENEILAKVAEFFNVTVEVLKSPRRTQYVAFARQVAYYLIYEETDLSYPAVGNLLNRDHSSVIHGHNLIAGRLKDRAFALSIEKIGIYRRSKNQHWGRYWQAA